jgi:hypothetical protein
MLHSSKRLREKVGVIWILNYRFANGRNIVELRGELYVIRQVLNSSYRILLSPLKNKPLGPKIHLKVWCLGCHLNLSNDKSGYKVQVQQTLYFPHRSYNAEKRTAPRIDEEI